MKVKLMNDIIYESFDNQKDMMEKILKMVLDANASKILYKGDPYIMDNKMLKRFLFKTDSIKVEPDKIKSIFCNAIKNDTRTFCVIYKQKNL